jgi:hypothetical protein
LGCSDVPFACSSSSVLVVFCEPNAPPCPKALDAPKADPELGCPNAVDPNADLAAPKAGPALAVVDGVELPNAEEPKAGVVEPNAGVLDPKAGVVDPNAGVVEPKAGVVLPEPAPAPPNPELPKAGAGVLAPEPPCDCDPKADPDPNAGVEGFVDPNAEPLPPNPAPNAGSLVGACPNPKAGFEPAFPLDSGVPNALAPSLDLTAGAGTSPATFAECCAEPEVDDSALDRSPGLTMPGNSGRLPFRIS